MDAEDKKKLDRILELVESNNTSINQIRRSQKNTQIFKAVYWLVIFIVMFGGLYFLQPYVNNLVGLYNGGIGALKSVQNIQSTINQKK